MPGREGDAIRNYQMAAELALVPARNWMVLTAIACLVGYATGQLSGDVALWLPLIVAAGAWAVNFGVLARHV